VRGPGPHELGFMVYITRPNPTHLEA
jgi:hypothetical protein